MTLREYFSGGFVHIVFGFGERLPVVVLFGLVRTGKHQTAGHIGTVKKIEGIYRGRIGFLGHMPVRAAGAEHARREHGRVQRPRVDSPCVLA